MDEDRFVGKEVHVNTFMNKGEDGLWSVKLVVVHRRPEDGEHWEEKHALMQSFDQNMDTALGSANASMVSYLQSVNFDLFSEDEDGEDNSPKN